MTSVAELETAVARAVAAAERIRAWPVRERAVALAEAARGWRRSPELLAGLPAIAHLSSEMAAEVVDVAATALDPDAMVQLVERDLGNAPGTVPSLVGHVLASNVPGLALPAIVHALLLGSACVVKSGRRDPLSAPLFRHALAQVAPELAEVVVTARWPRGTTDLDDALLRLASVVVLTGTDATIATLAPRARGRVITFGTRFSAAVVDDAVDIAALATDIALFEQRGCLSPHAIFVTGDPQALAARLARALETIATRLPPPPAALAERAAVRAFLDNAQWAGATVEAGDWGAVVTGELPELRPTCGHRTIHVAPLADPNAVARYLPAGRVECLATTGHTPPGLRERGVARVCPVGRMQRPPLSWPRGGRSALASLCDPAPTAHVMEVES